MRDQMTSELKTEAITRIGSSSWLERPALIGNKIKALVRLKINAEIVRKSLTVESRQSILKPESERLTNSLRKEKMNAKIEKINELIQQKINDCLIPAGGCFLHDEDGSINLQVERYREGARSLKASGRAEIAAEESAENEILKLAESLGFTLVKNGDGSGDHGCFDCYLLK